MTGKTEGEAPAAPDEEPERPAKGFDELLERQKPDQLHRLACNEVLQEVATFHHLTINEVKSSAETQWEKFWGNVLNYAKYNKKELTAKMSSSFRLNDDAPSGNFWEDKENWIYSRGQGFKRLVEDHLDELKSMPDDFVFNEIFGKWNRIQDDLGTFPLMAVILNFAKENDIDPKHLLKSKDQQPKEPSGETSKPPKREAPNRSALPDTLAGFHAALQEEMDYDPELVERICKELDIPINSLDKAKCTELLLNIYVVYGIDVEEFTRKF